MKHSVLFAIPFAAIALALCAPASAQPQAGGETKMQKAETRKPRTVRGMYDFPDKNHDGQLTRAEAKGHLPLTYRDFDKIDKDKRGWISFEQFLSYTNERVNKQADDVIRAGDKF